jgi:hypothetical protein
MRQSSFLVTPKGRYTQESHVRLSHLPKKLRSPPERVEGQSGGGSGVGSS